MSINHYSSDLAQSQWWSHYMNMDSSAAQTSFSNHKPTTTHSDINPAFWLSPHHPNAAAPPMFSAAHNNAVSFDLNNEDDDESPHDEHVARDTAESDQLEKRLVPKDRLFEKPLTPSDVGKLNRLVIPKQHAEKHFPLNGGDSGENGLLLGFEDELGKSWRFRYSYWNSSQSYVLTKGWSRFVKEKRLDAGDIVVFARHRVDAGRLFIGWRRRNSGGGQDAGAQAVVGSGGGGGGGWNRLYYSTQAYPSQQQQQHHGQSSLPSYQTDHCLHAGSSSVSQSQTTTGGNNNPKRLRLFGVNMECHQPDESEPSTPVGSPMSSQGGQPHHHHHYHQFYSNNHHNMDISFSGADVYRQG